MGFLPVPSRESATRGSLRTFLTFCHTPMCPLTNSSLSMPTHTTEIWGLPSALSVVRWASGPVAINERISAEITMSPTDRRTAWVVFPANMRSCDRHRLGQQGLLPYVGGLQLLQVELFHRQEGFRDAFDL